MLISKTNYSILIKILLLDNIKKKYLKIKFKPNEI